MEPEPVFAIDAVVVRLMKREPVNETAASTARDMTGLGDGRSLGFGALRWLRATGLYAAVRVATRGMYGAGAASSALFDAAAKGERGARIFRDRPTDSGLAWDRPGSCPLLSAPSCQRPEARHVS